MKGIRREIILKRSGSFINLDGRVPYLRENFVFIDKKQPLTGDAPKLFIREYEYGKGNKSSPRSWPAYIAKVGHKWYPVESITEQLLTDLGKLYGVNIANSKLALGSGQLRFLSSYFLGRDERLMHGAEIYAAYLNNDLHFVQEIEDHKLSSEFFTLKFSFDALKYSFPKQHTYLFTGLLEMLTFDAITGNNDRHFYNWGVILDVRKRSAPRFSPIYDTARALFWNYSEKRIAAMFSNKKQIHSQIVKYAKNSKPKMGIENLRNLNHFELISEVCRRYPAYINSIKRVLCNAAEADAAKLIDTKYGYLITEQRRTLIKQCLNFRIELLQKTLDDYE